MLMVDREGVISLRDIPDKLMSSRRGNVLLVNLRMEAEVI